MRVLFNLRGRAAAQLCGMVYPDANSGPAGLNGKLRVWTLHPCRDSVLVRAFSSTEFGSVEVHFAHAVLQGDRKASCSLHGTRNISVIKGMFGKDAARATGM